MTYATLGSSHYGAIVAIKWWLCVGLCPFIYVAHPVCWGKMRQRFEVLDHWRGVCAIGIALLHNDSVVRSHLSSAPFFHGLYMFVDFFFVLSGFVISHAYAEKLTGCASGWNFVLRRFGRLWPLHIAMLAAMIVLELVVLLGTTMLHHHTQATPFTGEYSLFAILTNTFLVQGLNVHSVATWNGPSWSISTEFYTYLIFAAVSLVATLAGRRRRAWINIIALLLITMSLSVLYLSSPSGMATTIDFGIFRCMAGFFTGVLVYRLWSSGEISFTNPTLVEASVILAVIVFLSLAVATPLSFLTPFLFGLVVLVFALESGRISAAMSTRWVKRLGTLSYSIYMVHMPIISTYTFTLLTLNHTVHWQPIFVRTAEHESVLQMQARLFSGDLFLVCYVAVVLYVASWTYRLVEQPGRTYFNGLARRFAGKPSVAPSELAPPS